MPQAPSVFVLTADMRSFISGSQYFEGACDAILQSGPGAFMISPGDIDPPDDVYAAVTSRIGPSYPWFPVVGNHDINTFFSAPHAFSTGIEWIRSYTLPFSVNPGPAGAETTCFSFNYSNIHVAVIDEYFDGVNDDVLSDGHGYVSPALLAWLEADLAATDKPVIFVAGHEPAYPQPDAETGRIRHLGDSLDSDPASRDAFWALLKKYGVKAYLCGHTHNYSSVEIDGVRQIDAGHARGIADTGAPSTFVKICVYSDGTVSYEAWRASAVTGLYAITDSGSF
jgi:3',5'-cyclic AMP phosphodiesterase CpdA